jgi:hypothetical protein
MFTSLGRAALALPVLLALVTPGRAGVGDEHLFPGNPSGATTDKGKAPFQPGAGCGRQPGNQDRSSLFPCPSRRRSVG